MDLANPASLRAPPQAPPQALLHGPPNASPNASPPAPPLSCEDPGLSATWLRFHARTPAGALRLWVQAPLGACSGTGAAIALDDCDLLLQGIDSWLADDLDWRWGDAPLPEGPGLACAECLPAADAKPSPIDRCRLELPWTLMRSAGSPPQPLAGRLRWHDTAARLSISRLWLQDAEFSDLERGGLLVLHESMAAGWKGWLHLPDEPPRSGCVIDLSAPGWPRLPSAAADSPDLSRAEGTGSHLCSVRIVIPAPLPAPLLTGWADPACGLAEIATGEVQLWLEASKGGPVLRMLASGRLVPWGHGCAMLIDERL